MRFTVLLALIASQSLGQSFDYHRATDDAHILSLFQDLAARGAYRVGNVEVAAFIVREVDGDFSCLLWPENAHVLSAHYAGRIPAGTVAVAHTHPPFAESPSPGDIAESKRIGLPIYVVSRWHLYVVDPSSGEKVVLIRQKSWMRWTARQKCHSFGSPVTSRK